jgi:serine protease inhibitor
MLAIGNLLLLQGQKFQSVALPYGNGAVSMYVFLPDEQMGLENFERELEHVD